MAEVKWRIEKSHSRGLKEPKAQPLVLLSRGKELPHERDSCE